MQMTLVAGWNSTYKLLMQSDRLFHIQPVDKSIGKNIYENNLAKAKVCSMYVRVQITF